MPKSLDVDWSALYLEEVSLMEAGSVGLGYTLFSIFMTLGRFSGDSISRKIGSISLIGLGSLIAALAFILILIGNKLVVLAGFSLTGVGLSVIIPEIFRLGGKTTGVSSSQGIAFVAGIGYTGFLMGPVILGFIASASSLKGSFLILLAFSLISFGLSFFINKKTDSYFRG